MELMRVWYGIPAAFAISLIPFKSSDCTRIVIFFDEAIMISALIRSFSSCGIGLVLSFSIASMRALSSLSIGSSTNFDFAIFIPLLILSAFKSCFEEICFIRFNNVRHAVNITIYQNQEHSQYQNAQPEFLALRPPYQSHVFL